MENIEQEVRERAMLYNALLKSLPRCVCCLAGEVIAPMVKGQSIDDSWDDSALRTTIYQLIEIIGALGANMQEDGPPLSPSWIPSTSQAFTESLQRASAEVATWPEWKQKAIRKWINER